MNNPLETFFPVEERDEGVYIKVTPDVRLKVRLRDVASTLDRMGVINYDLDRIKQVVDSASGEFELAGSPFEYSSEDLASYLVINVKPLKATLRFSLNACKENIRPSVNVIMYLLAGKGVCYGIKDDAIREFVADPVYDTDVVVAEGEAAVDGIDGQVVFEMDIDPDAKPTVDKGGKVDYRSINSFTSVAKGQIIARREPPTEGTPGKTVTGEDLEPKHGNDVKLPQGRNTAVSEDGRYLVAEKPGVIFQDGGFVHVEEMLHVQGNVDFSVGNVKYHGSVDIRGDVMPGFTVESDSDIHISGEVESAKVVSRGGTVIIDRGVIGKGETEIYGKEGVQVGFAQNATLRTDGTLTVAKSILHCTCTCERLETSSNQASVVGGSIRAYQHIEAASIGNEGGIPTKVCLVNKEKAIAEGKLKELEELKEKIDKQLNPVMRELKSKSAILKKAGNTVSDKQRQSLKKIVDSYNNLSTKAKYVQKKIEELAGTLEKPMECPGHIKVTNTIYPGVEMSLYGIVHKTMRVKMTDKTFRIKDLELHVDG